MGHTTETKSTSTSKVPSYIDGASSTAVEKAEKLAESKYKSNPREIAEFSADQNNAFQQIRNMLSGASAPGSSAETAAAAVTAGPETVGVERVVDEDGKLGLVADYLNPYIENALGPALRKIQEQSDAQRQQIGAMSTMSGAFGDARHGILESELGRNTSLAVGETSGNFLKNAFDAAMSQRSADLGRFVDVDKTNASLAEQARARQIDGAASEQQQMLQRIQALLSSGAVQTARGQAVNDAEYEDDMKAYDHQFKSLEALLAALGSARYTTTTQQTAQSPDNSIAQLAGAAVGALI